MILTLPYTSVLVALSGGADSVALLHALHKQGVHCVAAHCNFHLRGAESDRDERFVRSYCEQMGVECCVVHFDTIGHAKRRGISIEMAARELRYAWFEELLVSYKLPAVAVAHHADDNAETFLLNMTRGTGIKGLCGMKSVNGHVVRPMLGYSREYIELYCQANKLEYVTDSSNNSDEYTRNKLRHHVIPQLKEINPSFLKTMGENMSRLNSVYRVFRRQYETFVSEAIEEKENEIRIDMSAICSICDFDAFIFEYLHQYKFSIDSILNIVKCIEERRFGRVFTSDKYRLVVDRAALILTDKNRYYDDDEYKIGREETLINRPIFMRMHHIKLKDISKFELSRNPSLVHLDAEKVEYPLMLRRWRKGDTFTPLGMKGAKKLSDFFIDSKMSLTDKENVWLLVSASGEILWVVGQRISDKVKYTKATTEVLEIEIL